MLYYLSTLKSEKFLIRLTNIKNSGKMTEYLQIGIDLGGTKIASLVLDQTGKILHKQRIKTPQGDYQATLKAIVDLIIQAEKVIGQQGTIGIGVPGSLSPKTGLMRNANSTCLNGMPLKMDLEHLLKRSINIANDANCFVLSEATDGAAKEAKTIFGVIIGTGTGAGIVIDGQLLSGHNGIAGEWGHNPLPWITADEINQAHRCWCGQRDCIETWLNGAALVNDYFKASQQQVDPNKMVKRALSGDKIAEQILAAYENRLARGLAHIINILDPDMIVLGGGLSNIQRLYENVPKLWHQWIFSDTNSTALKPPKYGDASGVRGACWLGMQS